MSTPDFTPLHEQPDAPAGFGRLSVSFQGRVMHYVAYGPFDATLMEGGKRAAQMVANRVPADGRYLSLMELRGALFMDAAGLQEFRETVGAFIARSVVPLATILLVPPGSQDAEMLRPMLEIYRQSRPVHLYTDAASAWAQVNALLVAAALPAQPAPHFASA